LLTIDLHCHADQSDGALAPQASIARGAMQGSRVIALTDDDSVAAVLALAAALHAMRKDRVWRSI
jgi:predicted metal-dependent phosphoesterase TrpH